MRDDDDEELEAERPRKAKRRRRERDYDDDEDDRPDREGDGGWSTIIPYKNKRALTGYYLGFLALFPAVGLIVGPIAIILGIMGISFARTHSQAKGTAHAVVAIILGMIGFFLMAPLGFGLLYVAFFLK